MYDETVLLKVIAKLMIQIEEEKHRRVEFIKASLKPFSIEEPTTEDIERKIRELS
jgi:hypothetical protein